MNGLIKTTPNHPFYSRGKWVEAGNLKIGDKILHIDGVTHEITSIEVDETPRTVYNFEVENVHNYFAEGYLVHNKQNVDPGGTIPLDPVDPTGGNPDDPFVRPNRPNKPTYNRKR